MAAGFQALQRESSRLLKARKAEPGRLKEKEDLPEASLLDRRPFRADAEVSSEGSLPHDKRCGRRCSNHQEVL